MGLAAEAIRAVKNVVAPIRPPLSPVSGGVTGFGLAGGTDFLSFAQGAYRKNAIVYAALELLATSAAEPHITGWRQPPATRQAARMMASRGAQDLLNLGVSRRLVPQMLARAGLAEELPGHALVRLLNNPNPWSPRARFWAMSIRDRFLAGNWYAFKARGALGNPAELWRLRPDRVKPVPGDMAKGEPFVLGYDYRVDRNTVIRYQPEDVIHWKADDPLNDYEGMSPLVAISGTIDTENYQARFLRTFYERGGSGPGAILAVKGKIDPDAAETIKQRLRRVSGDYGAAPDTLLLDQAEASYTRLGLERGLRDALPAELNALTESRIAMLFGIPGSILGLLIGYESSSYANKRSDWQVFWDITMSPLMGDLDDLLTLNLAPEFGGIDEVAFDLSHVRALQEDREAADERHRRNFVVGLESMEEARLGIGLPPVPADGTFYVPSSSIPRAYEELIAPAAAEQGPPSNILAQISEGIRLGRPRIEDDAEARATWERSESLRRQYPAMTMAQLASRVGVAERTLRRYRERFAAN